MEHIGMQDRKLNICLVVNEFPGLTETFITTKALELCKKGHKVTVIKNQVNKLVNTSHLAAVKKAGINIISAPEAGSLRSIIQLLIKYPTVALQSISFSLKKFAHNFQSNLKSHLLKKYPFDIIHIEFSGLGVVYQKALEQSTAKTIVSCRGTAEKVKPLSEPHRKEQLKKLFNTVTAIHCVSQDMVNTIAPFCSDSSKVFINRPSIDTSIFKRNDPYPEQHATINILSIGRFTFQKGYLIGLMAMHILHNKGLQYTWTIVGDGPLKEEMIYHVNAFGIQDKVKMVGKKNRDEILELYNSTDIFLLTSFYEGIANVCLEAMSMELPVVATRSGGMEEVIEHGKDGLLCNTYDPESIANAVLSISENAGLRKLMGVHARHKVMNEFTIQKQADIFDQKYQQLTN